MLIKTKFEKYKVTLKKVVSEVNKKFKNVPKIRFIILVNPSENKAFTCVFQDSKVLPECAETLREYFNKDVAEVFVSGDKQELRCVVKLLSNEDQLIRAIFSEEVYE